MNLFLLLLAQRTLPTERNLQVFIPKESVRLQEMLLAAQQCVFCGTAERWLRTDSAGFQTLQLFLFLFPLLILLQEAGQRNILVAATLVVTNGKQKHFQLSLCEQLTSLTSNRRAWKWLILI